jgi:hypothetical protein
MCVPLKRDGTASDPSASSGGPDEGSGEDGSCTEENASRDH